MKRTKIIATVGPSCEDEETLRHLITLGVNVFRLNFKHNNLDWHRATARRIREICESSDVHVGVLLDLQGPEIRVVLSGEQIELKENEPVPFGTADFNITHPEILEHIVDGQEVVVNDGQFHLTFERRGKEMVLIPQASGVLKNRKSMNMPGGEFPLDVLTERDYDGIKLAAEEHIDFVALSFARTAEDVQILKKAMKEAGATSKIISKIEARQAISNLDAIIEESDAVMVARGDLGVEIPIEQVPHYQKKIIRKCFSRGVPVITATQMLESMIENPYPTRAEVSDVANAVLDLTDAVMLSGESALGKYPSESVNMMARTVIFNENTKLTQDTRRVYRYELDTPVQHICDAAYNIYDSGCHNNEFAGFLVLSKSGRTAQLISRYRPGVPIFTYVPTREIANSLTVNYGILPMVKKASDDAKREVEREYIDECLAQLTADAIVPENSQIIVVHGDYWGIVGGASTIRIVRTPKLT